MSTEDMPIEDTARRMAELLSDVMNITAIVHDELALKATDPAELRAALVRIVEEMTWLAPVVARGSIAGITWPPDGQTRVEALRAAADAWNPIHPPPPGVLSAAQDCLSIVQST